MYINIITDNKGYIEHLNSEQLFSVIFNNFQ